MAKVKAKVAKDFGTMYSVWAGKISAIKITNSVQTGIVYPATPLWRYHLEGGQEIVLEKGQQSIKIGRKWFYLDRDLAIQSIK